MLFTEPIAHAVSFVKELNEELDLVKKGDRLSKLQSLYLAFCLTALIVTMKVSWAAYERASLRNYCARALSYMLHHSKIPLNTLLLASVRRVLRIHSMTEGHMVIDDFERPRSKAAKTLYGLFKTKDKKTGGYVVAQNVVLLVLVCDKLTVPVGFEIYRPDPLLSAWTAEERIMCEAGVPKDQRKPKPKRREDYPTKSQLSVTLVHRFKHYFPDFKILSILADAAFFSPYYCRLCQLAYPKSQIVSQLKKTQLVSDKKGVWISVKDYFAGKPTKTINIELRGMKPKSITFFSGRLVIKSLGRKLHVIALSYDGEEPRYLVASKITWKAEDIIRAYGFRWLGEVVIQDHKVYQGGGDMGFQYGKVGASWRLVLSFILDHLLLTHPIQLSCLRTGKPLVTVGSLLRFLQLHSLLETIARIVESPNPKAAFAEFAARADDVAILRSSGKHMACLVKIRYGPSPSLELKFGNGST